MRTVGHLKAAVAGFLQRNQTDFIRDAGFTPLYDGNWYPLLDAGGQPLTGANLVGFDLLLQACDNARLYAERMIDFELAKVQVDFPATGLLTGVDLTTAVLHGTSTTVSVKKVLVPYLPMTDGTAFPVDLLTKRVWTERLKKRYAHVLPTDKPECISLTIDGFAVIQDGGFLMVVPPDATTLPTSFTISADAIKWMDTYTNSSQHDFLLQYAFDWLMYRSIQELNFFLKEDERVQISQAMVTDAWNAIVKWNNELLQANTDDTTLD